MNIFSLNTVLRAVLAALVFSCFSFAEQVTVTGSASGNRADSVFVREAALADAFEKASETAGFTIESNSILNDETGLISSIEIRSTGFVESYSILSEGWIIGDTYQVEIEATVVSMPDKESIREHPRISLNMEYPRELSAIVHKIISHLITRGFIISPDSENQVIVAAQYRDLGQKGIIHYAESDAAVTLSSSGNIITMHDLKVRGFGLTDQDALQRTCDKFSADLADKVEMTFSEKLAGLETVYMLIVEGRFDSDKLLAKLMSVPWIIGPNLISKNAVSATFSLSTNRGFAALQLRMKTWGYLNIGKAGNRLRFVYKG